MIHMIVYKSKGRKARKQKGGQPLPIGSVSYTPKTPASPLSYTDTELYNLVKSFNINDVSRFNELVVKIIVSIYPQVYPFNNLQYFNKVIKLHRFKYIKK